MRQLSEPSEPVDCPRLLPTLADELHVQTVDGHSVRHANLDHAATAPVLRVVAERVAELLPVYGSVHRGAGQLARLTTTAYERARESIAALVGARADDVVVFTRNTTDAINLLARSLPAQARAVVLDAEHHANLLTWQQRGDVVIRTQNSWADAFDRLAKVLNQKHPDLLAVTGASNVTGELTDLTTLAELAHAHGARIAVDAAQLAAHRPVDMTSCDLDYLSLSAHKLGAPYGAGALVGRRDWLDSAPPYLLGGGAARQVSADHADWLAAPARHEGGTPNVVGAVAFAAAGDALRSLPPGVLAGHDTELGALLRNGLAQTPHCRVLRCWPDAPDVCGVTSFVLAGHDPALVATVLAAEYGVSLRHGKFCAHPLVERLAGAAGALRASIGPTSALADLEQLFSAFRQYLTHGPRYAYRRLDGYWQPHPAAPTSPVSPGPRIA